MKICPYCGANNKDVNNFCSSCGEKLESTVPVNQVQGMDKATKYQITFKRPDGFQMMANAFSIKVDHGTSYDLRNGSEIKLMMAQGQHSVEISVFGVPRKKQFCFQVTSDMIFICKPNPLSGLNPLFAIPLKVSDSNGREY